MKHPSHIHTKSAEVKSIVVEIAVIEFILGKKSKLERYWQVYGVDSSDY